MAVPVVPVPFLLCRSKSRRRSSLSLLPENISWVRGTGLWNTAGETLTRGSILHGSSTLTDCEGSIGHSWTERTITATLLSYEILEKRAKFTVYKILVTGRHRNSWVIFRRYIDFCRLRDKLKELFPRFAAALPPKRWFKDDFDERFLEETQTGLQRFLQSLTSHRDIISSDAVRQFLCLADQPSPFDSLEERRAACETLEENNHRLQRELLENQKAIDTLKRILQEKENHISFLVKKVKPLYPSLKWFEDSCQRKAKKLRPCDQS